jgi:hypothetical protein
MPLSGLGDRRQAAALPDEREVREGVSMTERFCILQGTPNAGAKQAVTV